MAVYEQLASIKKALSQPQISLTKNSDLYFAAQHLFYSLSSVEKEHFITFLDIFLRATENFQEYAEKWLVKEEIIPTSEELTLIENFCQEISLISECLLKSDIFSEEFVETNQSLQKKVKFLLVAATKEKVQRQLLSQSKKQPPWRFIFPLALGIIGLLGIVAFYWIKKRKKATIKQDYF